MEYKENPVFLDSIYNIEGKKIGYLIYNAFYADNGDGSLSYEKQVNRVFGKFKEQEIDELIVDLRYNSGGLVTSAIDLASMIVSEINTGTICVSLQYNSIVTTALRDEYGSDYFDEYFRDKFERTSGKIVLETIPINNAGVQRVHFIVSRRTASASELVINSLNPLMDVVLIGTTTIGKNVGSISIYEKNNPRNTWGMQPLVLRLTNCLGLADYGNGFEPHIISYDHKNQIKPLGDVSETMLAAALDNIFGRTVSSSKILADDEFKLIGSSLDLNPSRANMTYSAIDLKFIE
jgi:C-terminal processing protease CtpA/Prc